MAYTSSRRGCSNTLACTLRDADAVWVMVRGTNSALPMKAIRPKPDTARKVARQP